jgi:hypothetical protein
MLMKFFSHMATLLNKSELLLKKTVGLVSDGAPAMIGKNNGIGAKLKK